MEIIVSNTIQVVTDRGIYIRLDTIDSAYVDGLTKGRGFIVRGWVRGVLIDLTDPLPEPEAISQLKVILDAQKKYAPVVKLCTRYDYSGTHVIYEGYSSEINPPVTDPNWLIMKFTWVGNNMTMKQGPLTGAWDQRSTLGWT